MTSGRLASLRLPLIAISATPRSRARRPRATPTPSSRGCGRRPAPAPTMPLDRRGAGPPRARPRAARPRAPRARARRSAATLCADAADAARAAAAPAPRGSSRPGATRGRPPAPDRPRRLRASSSRTSTLLADLPVGRGQLDHQPALEPGAEPRLHPGQLGERARPTVNTSWRPDSSQQVEQHEQLVLGPVLVRDQVDVVEQERGGPPVARAPGGDRVAIDGLDQLAGELGRAEAGHRAGRRIASALPMACSRCVLPDPARAHDDQRVVARCPARRSPRATASQDHPVGRGLDQSVQPPERRRAPAADAPPLARPLAARSRRPPGRRGPGTPPRRPGRAPARPPRPAAPAAARRRASNSVIARSGSATVSCSSSASSRAVRKPSPSQRRMAAPTCAATHPPAGRPWPRSRRGSRRTRTAAARRRGGRRRPAGRRLRLRDSTSPPTSVSRLLGGRAAPRSPPGRRSAGSARRAARGRCRSRASPPPRARRRAKLGARAPPPCGAGWRPGSRSRARRRR